MIKTAQDAYLAGRQAAMEKIAAIDYKGTNANALAANLGFGIRPSTVTGRIAPIAGTVAGTALGTYLGDRNLRSAGISAVGALGGGQIGSNLALAGISALRAASGLDQGIHGHILENKILGDIGLIGKEPEYSQDIETDPYLAQYERDIDKHIRFNMLSSKILGVGNLIGQLAGGAAAGHYSKRG